MGKSLAAAFPAARRVFDEADEVLGFRLSTMCFEGPEADLKLTENTQPALLTVSTAAHAVVQQQGIPAAYVAGHSLGEYAALVAAGALAFADALQLVRNRGLYMQQAVPAGTGAMAALLKLPLPQLAGVLNEAAQGEIVAAANLNSPEQIVIAGHTNAVNRAMALAKQAGAKRAILLPVSAPFHCPLMLPAQARLRPELEAAHFSDLKIPLVNNWAAQQIQSGAEARTGLLEQIPRPVRWQETMALFGSLECRRFVEVGAGSVLTGLVRANLPAAQCVAFGETGQLDPLLAFAK